MLTNLPTSPRMTTVRAVQGTSVTRNAARVFCFGDSMIRQE